jgi:hypothetical protein
MVGDKNIYHFDIIEYDEPDKKKKNVKHDESHGDS